jgi:chemotaxis protein CheX
MNADIKAHLDAAAARPTSAWTDYVRDSLNEVFNMMLGMKVTPCEDTMLFPELTAIVGLAGSLCGLFSIRCSKETGAVLTRRMLHVETSGGEAEVMDALGELCNMLAGSFKAKVPGIADTCMLSIPTTIAGADYKVHPLRGGRRFNVLVHCDDEFLEVILHVNC